MMSENIIFAVNAVGPLVLLILLGTFLKRRQIVSQTFFEQGNKLVFQLLIPCSTYCNIYACPSLSDIDVHFLGYGALSAFFIFFAGLLTTHIFIREKISRSAAHQCTFRSNIPVLGNALATSLAGTAGATLLATFMLVIIPLLNVFAVITLTAHENTSRKSNSFRSVFWNILKNPLIIACLLGFVTLLVRNWLTPESGIPAFTLSQNMPFIYNTISKLAAATTPISLIVLGGLVDFSSVKGSTGYIFYGVIWKLIVAPAAAIGGAVMLSNIGIMKFGAPEYAVLLSVFGSSVAVASAPMTAEMGGDAELSRQYVVWTNVFLILSMPLEIILMRVCGLL